MTALRSWCTFGLQRAQEQFRIKWIVTRRKSISAHRWSSTLLTRVYRQVNRTLMGGYESLGWLPDHLRWIKGRNKSMHQSGEVSLSRGACLRMRLLMNQRKTPKNRATPRWCTFASPCWSCSTCFWPWCWTAMPQRPRLGRLGALCAPLKGSEGCLGVLIEGF